MAGGALVDDTVLLAREVRGYPVRAQFLHQLLAVVTRVGAQRDPTPPRDLLDHHHCRLGFGATAGLSYTAVDRQAVAIFHQHVTRIAELGFLALTFASQQGCGVTPLQ